MTQHFSHYYHMKDGSLIDVNAQQDTGDNVESHVQYLPTFNHIRTIQKAQQRRDEYDRQHPIRTFFEYLAFGLGLTSEGPMV